MAVNKAPTKANLMKSKNMLKFSVGGFELLDKKRNVLIREMMGLVKRAEEIQKDIADSYEDAYRALQYANVTMGLKSVEDTAISIPMEKEFKVLLKSVMGVEIPEVSYEDDPLETYFGFFRTNPALDEAILKFKFIRQLTYELAEVESSVYKLAIEIRKTQKRANALEKIQIPKYKEVVKYIEESLEEKEREDFFRLKKVKGIGK